jgi:HNH endonuclease
LRKANGLKSQCRSCANASRPASITLPTEKQCSVCKETKPANEFYGTDRNPSGLYSRCKDCHNQRAAPGQARYRQVNEAKVREWLNRWEVQNRDARRAINHKRRARERQVESTFTREQWAALKAAYSNRCAYCGKPSKRLTIDHVIPLSQGGPHMVQNIVPACKPCNSGKKDRAAPTHQMHLIQ